MTELQAWIIVYSIMTIAASAGYLLMHVILDDIKDYKRRRRSR